jgi:protein-tyrosine phosphatase
VLAVTGLVTALLAGVLASGCTPQPAPGAPATLTPAPTATSPRPTPAPRPTPTPTTRATAPGLELSSVANFRDVAGSGLSLGEGTRMATGVVYRSAALFDASRSDLARLRRAGITLVIDLRTDVVAASQPDPRITGARHRQVDIFGAHGGAVRGTSVAGARASMRQMNIDFVASASQRARIADALTLIASATSPVLVHCQAGKDRTGWISALLQLIAGADQQQVMSEYLKSNEYRAQKLADAYRRTLASRGPTAARIQRAHLSVDPTYLNAGLDELERGYGTLDGYLTDGLGLSRATIEALKQRLTA